MRRICLRRMPNTCSTNVRKRASSAASTAGASRGTMRTMALSTFGGGLNAPAGTAAISSAIATACTFTDRAPYVRDPGPAVSRSATSRCTKYTARSGRGRASAWKRIGVVM